MPGTFSNAIFVYDGDGKRVKSIFNGTTTTYFVGAHYEVTGSTVTKYYYAGAQRIAMRTGGTLNFLLGDHLSSTSLTTSATGTVISELRYKAWGEVRYASGTTPTKYQYTGQFSYASDFGLMFYGARWYDPYLNHFTQPDSIVPDPYNALDWNRYSYVRYNPVRYTDPSGHCPEEDAACRKILSTLLPKPKVNGWQKFWQSVQGWLMPSTGPFSPVVAPAPEIQSPFQLPQNATVTPQPSTPTPQLSGQVTAQSSPTLQNNVTGTSTPTTTPNPTPARIQLFRAINGLELADILSTGTYGFSPHGGPKYFAYTYSGVANFANSPFNQEDMTITTITVPADFLENGYDFIDVGGAGPSIAFPETVLPALYNVMSPIIILPSP